MTTQEKKVIRDFHKVFIKSKINETLLKLDTYAKMDKFEEYLISMSLTKKDYSKLIKKYQKVNNKKCSLDKLVSEYYGVDNLLRNIEDYSMLQLVKMK